jgi:hypothetical protein
LAEIVGRHQIVRQGHVGSMNNGPGDGARVLPARAVGLARITGFVTKLTMELNNALNNAWAVA